MLRSVAVGRFLPLGGRYDLARVIGRHSVQPIAVSGDQAIVARFSAQGLVVVIELLATPAVPRARLEEAMEIARGMAGLDDDPRPFAELVRGHPLLARWHRRFGGLRLTRSATVFEVMANAVLGQLVTFEEARAARNRIRKRYGVTVPGTDLVLFPPAEIVAAIPPHELREMGVGIRRATTLREVARRAPSLERLRSRDPEEAIAAMQTLRGVGPWTANKVAIEALGYPDGVYVGDAVAPLVLTMALTGKAGGDPEMLACLEPFRPHRARVHQLFHLAELIDRQIPGVPPRPLPTVDPHRRKPWT